MSMIRTKIAERMVHAQQTAAILTTFNEIDMGPVMEIRQRFKDGYRGWAHEADPAGFPGASVLVFLDPNTLERR